MLAVMVLILAVVLFLLIRKMDERSEIVGGSFSFLASIHGLNTPLGVGTDADARIYVSNTASGEVIVYDQDGIEVRKLNDARDQNGEILRFYSPKGIAVDNETEKLYVCDYNWRGVRVFTKAGDFLYNLPRDPNDIPLDPEYGFAPYDVAVGKDRVYVVSKDGIYVFDSQGAYLDHWGTRGNQVGQYDFPNGIAVDRESGNIFVADSNNRRVVSLTGDGSVRWILGTETLESAVSVFELPRSVAVGPDGLVYVADVLTHRIFVIDQDGNLVSAFGERGTADGQFNFPESLAVAANGRMYVADRANNRVQIWQLDNKSMPEPTRAEAARFKDYLHRF